MLKLRVFKIKVTITKGNRLKVVKLQAHDSFIANHDLERYREIEHF